MLMFIRDHALNTVPVTLAMYVAFKWAVTSEGGIMTLFVLPTLVYKQLPRYTSEPVIHSRVQLVVL